MNKKKFSAMFIILVILMLGIGYAYLNTSLTINGSSIVSSSNWDIHFENVQVKDGSVSASTPAINIAKDTVTYSITLHQPGDYYEFTIDAKNAGTIDGMISAVTSKLNGSTITTLPDYLDYSVTYEDDLEIQINHLLAANTKETYKVHIGYKSDIEKSQLPETDQTLNLSFEVTYSQATDSAQEVGHAVTKYTSKYSNTIIGQAIPSHIIQYNSAAEAMEAYYNSPVCLKHIISNGIIKESYVVFLITPEMASSNPGMIAGTYTLRGAGAINDVSPYYETNKETLLNAFGSTNCSEEYIDGDVRYQKCQASLFMASVHTSGTVNFQRLGGSSRNCEVMAEGGAYCQ